MPGAGKNKQIPAGTTRSMFNPLACEGLHRGDGRIIIGRVETSEIHFRPESAPGLPAFEFSISASISSLSEA